MNGVRLGQVFAVVVLTTALIGCAGSRGGCRSGGCRVSSASSVPPRRTLTNADHETPRSLGQRNCPVTGEKLGSMGPPIPVTVNGRTIQVCCDGCVAAVKKSPDKYLKIVDDEVGQSEGSGARQAAFYDRPTQVRTQPPMSNGHSHSH